VFRGVHSLLGTMVELLNRPGWSRADLRGDRPLPLICVIGQPEAERFVDALAQRLEDTPALS
jgi:hypothetical protein